MDSYFDRISFTVLDFASYNGGMEEKQFTFLIIYLAKENTMQLQTCRALYLFTLILMNRVSQLAL